MPDDVLAEDPFGADLADDPGDFWPEVPGVVLAATHTGEAEGLAGIAGRDEMNSAAPRPAFKGSQIVPYNSRSQGRVRHPCHESGRGETVSLDITHGSISGLCEMKAEVQSSDAGAKAEAAKVFMSLGGTNSHTMGPFRRGPAALVKGSSMASGCSAPGTAGT